MSKPDDKAIRLRTLAMLDTLEVGIVNFAEAFELAAAGERVDPQHAENLAFACRMLLKQLADVRVAIRLADDSPGVH
jgi:hypothetical protein